MTEIDTMAKTKKGNTPLVAFRLDEKIVKDLDAHARRMSAATPGVTFTRADALRALLIPALAAAEAADKRKTK
ncbi:MAG: hypothetical protein JO257_22715 [Deltaproteobacteria bacterium]|nr:hypothetical protein [Deltaproteobacteria bacterium]